MAITYENIKLMKSERLDDTPEGGGKMTGNEVISGEVNDLFPPISHLDQTYGRVRLRKVFPAILSSASDAFYGTHVIISRPPQNKDVKFFMFQTPDRDDVRKDAVEYIQNHVIASSRRSGFLVGKHPSGLASLTVLQPTNEEPFKVGQTLYLVDVKNNVQSNGEYVRISNVSVNQNRSVVVPAPGGGYTTIVRDEYVLTLSRPLEYDHVGNDPTVLSYPQDGTYIYNTVAIDSHKYYGIAPLAKPASAGDLCVTVKDIYCNIVPAARVEVALSNKSPLSASNGIIPCARAKMSGPSKTCTNGTIVRLPTGIVPGTITGSISDDGAGTLKAGSSVVGRVNYENGVLSFTTNVTLTSWQYLPGAAVNTFNRVLFEYITLENRRTTFVKTLIPYPTAPTVRVRYRAMGNWYTLGDDGTGTLRGATGAGVGTVDYSSGTVNVTLGALPDIDTPVVFEWASLPELGIAKASSVEKACCILECGKRLDGEVTVSYFAGGVQKTVSGTGDTLTGDGGTAVVRRADGTIILYPSEIPDQDIDIAVSCTNAYHPAGESGELNQNYAWFWTATAIRKQLSLQQGTSIVPGSFVMTITSSESPQTITITDDGNGNLVTGGGQCGTIDYVSGLVVLYRYLEVTTWEETKTYNVTVGTTSATYVYAAYHDYLVVKPTSFYGSGAQGAVTPETTANNLTIPDTLATTYFPINGHSPYSIHYTLSNGTPAELAATFPVKLTMRTKFPASYVIDRTFIFQWAGRTYYEHNGAIYTNFDHNTGDYSNQVGTMSGTTIQFTQFPTGSNTDPVVISGLFSYSDMRISSLAFVTELSDLAPGSFQLVYRSPDGDMRYVDAGADGILNDDYVNGYVNFASGIVLVGFGRWIPMKPEYESESWYNPKLLNNSGTMVFRPERVPAGEVRYNAVAYKYMPLDPQILGIDSLRLPPDGRVPIFRPGDVVVVHNTQETTLPDNIRPGQRVQLPRGDLSHVDIFDQNGKYVNPNLYDVDPETGLITFADPLDLSQYTQPLIAYHRREDMKLVSDVQLSGDIRFTSPISHDYPLDGYSYVSSAFLIGDLQARVVNVFDQKTWTGVWSDQLIGDPCTANYNIVDYPILVTNDGAVTERWALVFTSETDFKVIGERLGVIGSGNIGNNCAPINPVTGRPYFTIRAAGWGTGWAYNNVLRFNTIAAHTHLWIGRTTLQGADLETPYNCTVQIRGDAE